eukprot:TRINITY_DN38358_c0_g1_i1.p1 TRINITY_DN38358_c0_g1~~TRINITY_DN38358_c0_g1_i1.p1  ORF type:complete len:321 (+),score=33.34 TRINITY_DN38358_c0_g1_i1:62-1024(+)
MAKSVVGLGTHSSDNEKFYDEWADDYTSDVRKWGYDAPERVAALVRKHVSSPEKLTVLDAGAGDGLAGIALHRVGFRQVFGCDISAELMKRAKEKGIYRETQITDLSKPLQYADNTFDICICVGVLTYLEPSSGVLSEFVRVTKPGGLICYTNRTDKVSLWKTEEAKLTEGGLWEESHVSKPLPYLPNNPEYGSAIQVVMHLFRVLENDHPEKKKLRVDLPVSAPVPTKCVVLRYSYVEGILERRAPYRAGHLAHWKVLADEGRLLLGGALDPPEAAYLILKGVGREDLEALVKADPYVINGLVSSFDIKDWNVVIGSAL